MSLDINSNRDYFRAESGKIRAEVAEWKDGRLHPGEEKERKRGGEMRRVAGLPSERGRALCRVFK